MDIKEIVDILRCPECKSSVSIADENTLVCTNCDETYPIKNGVPIMIAANGSSDGVEPVGSNNETKQETWFERTGHRLYKTLSPPEGFCISGKGKITNFVSSFGDDAYIVDIGSGSKRWGKNVINLDIAPFPNVDIVFGGGELPIRDNAVGGVVSIAVLEHVPNPTAFVSEVFRILKGEGQVLVTAPFIQGFHLSPSDYQRFTLSGLDVLFSKFEKLDSGIDAGPSSALAWIAREWIASFADNQKLYRLLRLVGGWIVLPIKYFDIILSKRRFAYKIAGGLYYVGRKPRAE
jgi:uncharacterized protein YbaR (Trm112 family)/SAM-dependent methyltransferase